MATLFSTLLHEFISISAQPVLMLLIFIPLLLASESVASLQERDLFFVSQKWLHPLLQIEEPATFAKMFKDLVDTQLNIIETKEQVFQGCMGYLRNKLNKSDMEFIDNTYELQETEFKELKRVSLRDVHRNLLSYDLTTDWEATTFSICRQSLARRLPPKFYTYFDFLEPAVKNQVGELYRNGEYHELMRISSQGLSRYITAGNFDKFKNIAQKIKRACVIGYENALCPADYDTFKYIKEIRYVKSAFEYLDQKITTMDDYDKDNYQTAFRYCMRLEQVFPRSESKDNELFILKLFNIREHLKSITLEQKLDYKEEIHPNSSFYIDKLFQNIQSSNDASQARAILNSCATVLSNRLNNSMKFSCCSWIIIDLKRFLNAESCTSDKGFVEMMQSFEKAASKMAQKLEPICLYSLNIMCNSEYNTPLKTGIRWDEKPFITDDYWQINPF